jgi:hypothetical protein
MGAPLNSDWDTSGHYTDGFEEFQRVALILTRFQPGDHWHGVSGKKLNL